jgi:hypothetical protein
MVPIEPEAVDLEKGVCSRVEVWQLEAASALALFGRDVYHCGWVAGVGSSEA